MQNQNYLIAEKLLKMSPEDEINDIQHNTKLHTKENIIPPVGIANPELMQSFMENIEDEEKILRDIKDVENYQKENKFESAEREIKSYGLRALEGLGGTLGALMNALSGEVYFNDKGEPQENVPKWPSTSELREFTKEKTGKKFEPKTSFAKEAHEATTDIGAGAILPGGWISKLITPVAGQGVKALAKHQGATEQTADKIKLAFMMSSTLANLGNAPQMAKNAYHEAVNMIPKGTRMSTKYLQQELNSLKNQPWYKTGVTAEKSPAFTEIERIEKSIQHGSMDIQDAMQIRKDINSARKRLGSFLYEPGVDKASARQYLDRVDEVLRTNLERYGQAKNPDWLRKYQLANEAYSVTKNSQALQEFIASNAVTKNLNSQTAKFLFNLGGAVSMLNAPSYALGALPVMTGAKGIQILNRMYKSPVLRNHYLEVIKAASTQNAGAMNRALQKLDKEAEKLESKKKFIQ